MVETISAVLRVMPRGGGFPSLVETISGRRFIVKLSGVGQGVSGLLTEFVATRLAAALGLKVPRVLPLMLSKALPWQTGTDEFYDALQRSSGWNLGVEFVDDAQDVAANGLGDIPADFLDRLSSVDSLLQNVDRTLQNPNLLRDRKGEYWAIDFGACLFLDRFARFGSRMTFELPTNHFAAGRRVATLTLENAHVPLREVVSDIPDSWADSVPGGRQALLEALSKLIDVYIYRKG
ncbi:MAG TPA: HipA family kinase [Hyphomicrobiaceae bacterium]|jgi:hypothetical protein|nr:HipA family kinase [Hyphomicrobiaceae bacterium]